MSTPVDASQDEPGHAPSKGHPFAADPRSLAAFRVALGAALLGDLVGRAPDLEAHYTDVGILPRSMLEPFGRLVVPWHRLTGAAWGEGLLFAVAAVFAAALLIGYHTRLATVLSWAMLLSLHGRNTLVLSGGDPLLRIFLFWSMFLPLGACWSVDAARRPAAGGAPRALRSMALTATLLQAGAMYFFTGLLKLESPAWRSGRALGLVLPSYHLTTSLGAWMVEVPGLLRALTYGVLALELLGPIFLFWPWRWLVPARTLALLAFLGLQVGIELTMPVGNFQMVSVILMIPLVPSATWDWLLPRLRRTRLGAAVSRLAGRLARHAGRGGAAPWAGARAPRILDATAGALGVYLLVCNVWTLFSRHDLPGRPERLAYALGIDQRWSMYANDDSMVAPMGWTVVPAQLEDGATVDLSTGQEPVSWEKPRTSLSFYGDWRWHRLVTRWIWPPEKRYRPTYAAYRCLKWNREHPARRATSLEIVWMRQPPARGGERPPPRPVSLWKGACPEAAR